MRGENLLEGQPIGYIDTLQLYLKKKILKAQIRSILSQKPEISTQLASFNETITIGRKRSKTIYRSGKRKMRQHKNNLMILIYKLLNLSEILKAQKFIAYYSNKLLLKNKTTPPKGSDRRNK